MSPYSSAAGDVPAELSPAVRTPIIGSGKQKQTVTHMDAPANAAALLPGEGFTLPPVSPETT